MAADLTDEMFQFEVLVVEDSKEVRDIILWLVRSSGYRALAAADRSVVQALLMRPCPLLVVGAVPTIFSDGPEMLAFSNMRRPQIPVLIVRETAFYRWPEVEQWANGFPRKPCSAARFRRRVHRLMSHVMSRQELYPSVSVSGKPADREFHANSNPSGRPNSPLLSHASAYR